MRRLRGASPFAALIVALSLLQAVPVPAAAAPARAARAKLEARTGRLIVKLHRRGAQATRASAASLGAARAIPQIGVLAIRPRPGESLRHARRRLRAEPGVASVQYEHRFALRYVTDDPALHEQGVGLPAGTPAEWELAKEGVYRGWSIDRGDGAKVAIVDTGADSTHPDLRGKIVYGAGSDPNGHGTHVASLACGAGDNGIGIVGAGLDCELIIEQSDLSDASVAHAIVDAVGRGADAINMSFGDDGSAPPSTAIVAALAYAYSHGVVLVAAAADDPTTNQGAPADVLQPSGTGPSIASGEGLDVTAARFDGRRADFAGYGTQISLAAYGTYYSNQPPYGLLGAFPANLTELEQPAKDEPDGCQCRVSFDGDPRYAELQGTSMAAPQVAAIAAVVHHLNPWLGAAGVMRILKRTATRPAGSGWTQSLGWGIVNAGRALALARTTDLISPRTHTYAPRRVRKRSWIVRWRGHDRRQGAVKRSGIAYYLVYRSKNGHALRRIAKTRRTSLRFRGGARGARYRFVAVAVDRDGNREQLRGKRGSTTRVLRRRARPAHRSARHARRRHRARAARPRR